MNRDRMVDLLVGKYGFIPAGSMEAYRWLKEESGVEDDKLDYSERVSRHNDICELLKFRTEGGLAGRDINNY